MEEQEASMYADTEVQEAFAAETQTEAAEAHVVPSEEPTKKSEKVKDAFKQFFTARRMVYIATFIALSVALRFLSFPILPIVPFLKFDFSDVLVLICAYALGPVSGIITCVIKEMLAGIDGGTAFIGELANIITMLPFVLIPSIIYKKHKGRKSVIIWLSVACVIRTAWSFPVNWLLTFPIFFSKFIVPGSDWAAGMQFFIGEFEGMPMWFWATLFNLIKGVMLVVSILLLYKPVSRLIGIINRKFDDRKRQPAQDAAQ
ncbi:MAG: ECF transporter S component [Clostridiales bacterium]|nr:ECF transporter S component [Clostridiales bacterium]